jgi:hypothetical protein
MHHIPRLELAKQDTTKPLAQEFDASNDALASGE